MKDLYSQEFLYHYKNQPNKKTLSEFNYEAKDVNFSCGDEIEVQLLVNEEEEIIDIGYKPEGCIISTGTMSVLADYLIGKKIDEVKSLSKESVLDIIGLEVTPSREKCVMVGVNALKKAVK